MSIEDTVGHIGSHARLLARAFIEAGDPAVGPTPHEIAIAAIERPLIVEMLRLCGQNQSQTAMLLGMHRNSLRARMQRYELMPSAPNVAKVRLDASWAGLAQRTAR